MLPRNYNSGVRMGVRLGLYKVFSLSVLPHGLSCVSPPRKHISEIKRFQGKVEMAHWEQKYKLHQSVETLEYSFVADFLIQLTVTSCDDETDLILPEVIDDDRRQHEVSKLPKRRTQREREEFVFRTCRIVKRLATHTDVRQSAGLKNRMLEIIWKFFSEPFSETNI